MGDQTETRQIITRWLRLLVMVGLVVDAPAAADVNSWREYPEAQRHIILVQRNGEPVQPFVERRSRGAKGWQYRVTPKSFGATADDQEHGYEKYVSEIVNASRSRGKVFIFVHGGMNIAREVAERAAFIVGEEEQQRREPRSAAHQEFDFATQGYPIFICWESPFTGYFEQLLWIRAGKTEKYGRGALRSGYALLTAPFHFVADVGRAITRFPALLSEEAYSDIYSMNPSAFTEFQRMQEQIAALRGEAGVPPRNLLVPEHAQLDVSRVDDSAPAARRALQNAGKIAFFPIRTATTPLIDTIGVGAWNNMLRHTDTMFDRTLKETYRTHTPIEVAQKRKGAVAAFFKELSEKRGRVAVTIVGHSMGSIVANRAISSFPELNYRNIVYMAAACSVREFQTCVIPYLREHKDTHFYGLSLHPRNEAGEVAVSPGKFSLDVAPRGSLLVWIDNIFGSPPSEQQRRFGIYQTAILSSDAIPEELRPQVTLKCFPESGADDPNSDLIWDPKHHADFSKAPYWSKEFWKTDLTDAFAARRPTTRNH